MTSQLYSSQITTVHLPQGRLLELLELLHCIKTKQEITIKTRGTLLKMSIPPEEIPQNHTIPSSEKVIAQDDVESEREPTLCLMIDNYDSFTFNLYQYFCQLGAEMMVKRNDEITIPEVEASPPPAPFPITSRSTSRY